MTRKGVLVANKPLLATIAGIGLLFIFVVILPQLSQEGPQGTDETAEALAAEQAANVADSNLAASGVVHNAAADAAAEAGSSDTTVASAEAIQAMLAPGVALSASTSSGIGYCSGPNTYVFDAAKPDGSQLAIKHVAESEFLLIGQATVQGSMIMVTNVQQTSIDPNSGIAPTSAPDWSLMVTAVDPNGSEGGNLTVDGEGELIGCNASNLTG